MSLAFVTSVIMGACILLITLVIVMYEIFDWLHPHR